MMINAPSFASGVSAIRQAIPGRAWLNARGHPTADKLADLFLIQSDGEYWFNTDSLDKHLGMEGLSEHELNVLLYVGHTTCPSCSTDLALPYDGKGLPAVGFYDYDVDNVRIQHQFACKKCRHQWGPPATGTRDGSLTAVKAEARASSGPASINEPKEGTAGAAAWAVADRVYAEQGESAPWKAFRLVVIEAGEAEGQNPGNVGTELPRWRKLRDTFKGG